MRDDPQDMQSGCEEPPSVASVMMAVMFAVLSVAALVALGRFLVPRMRAGQWHASGNGSGQAEKARAVEAQDGKEPSRASEKDGRQVDEAERHDGETNAEEEQREEKKATDDTYILPDSDREECDVHYLMDMSAEDLCLARNEIYARHGCEFETKSIREFFETKGWYEPTIPSDRFDDDSLSDIERRNVEAIMSVERPKERGRAAYVASHLGEDQWERHRPDMPAVYHARLDGRILAIEGSWRIYDSDAEDSEPAEVSDEATWRFLIADDADLPRTDASETGESHQMSWDELTSMVDSPSGLGLRLETNEDGVVMRMYWMS